MTSRTAFLEQQALEVCFEMFPEDRERRDSEYSLDLNLIVDIVMAIMQQVMDNCDRPSSDIAASFRSPTRSQRAALLKQCMDTCGCCGPLAKKRAGQISAALLKQAAELSQEDAVKLVDEARSVNYLLF